MMLPLPQHTAVESQSSAVRCQSGELSGSDILRSVIKLSRFRRQRRLCLSIAALCTLCTARSPICLGKVPPSNERSRSCNKFHIYHPSVETEGGEKNLERLGLGNWESGNRKGGHIMSVSRSPQKSTPKFMHKLASPKVT